MADVYDVAVIGGGPGGYVAALRSAQLGLKTVCIDDGSSGAGKPAPGGTCTNVGCIPSKALLQSSEYYARAGHDFAAHGISAQGLSMDVARMLARKDAVVAQNNAGITYLLKKNKVAFVHGRAAFAAREAAGWRLEITPSVPAPAANAKSAPACVTAAQVVIATGSRPRALNGAPFDHKRIIDSSGALALTSAPARLGIIGAGVVGVELGSVWQRLGSRVTLLEAAPVFLGGADDDIARAALKCYTEQGLDIRIGVALGTVTARKTVAVAYNDAQGAAQRAEFDTLIVAVGRVPNIEGLNIGAAGLVPDTRGGIAVDGDCRTAADGIWAIGDVVRGPMLAHKAEEEGLAVAERIAGRSAEVDFETVPWVIYTAPEIAWVGRNERQLQEDGIAYRAGSFPFSANGRARALGDTVGMVKLLADARSDRVLGVHIIGPSASELIAEAALAMQFGASAEDIALGCHAHPTLSEALREAALAAGGRPLHI